MFCKCWKNISPSSVARKKFSSLLLRFGSIKIGCNWTNGLDSSDLPLWISPVFQRSVQVNNFQEVSFIYHFIKKLNRFFYTAHGMCIECVYLIPQKVFDNVCHVYLIRGFQKYEGNLILMMAFWGQTKTGQKSAGVWAGLAVLSCRCSSKSHCRNTISCRFLQSPQDFLWYSFTPYSSTVMKNFFSNSRNNCINKRGILKIINLYQGLD